MPKGYKILDHKADLKMQFFGKTKEELFSNAAVGLGRQLLSEKDAEQIELETAGEEINLRAKNLESLLVDWLNEILARSDLNEKIYLNFEIDFLTDTSLEARIQGMKAAEKKIEIKAATYHDLKIEQLKNGWQATVIFDI
jgi:SHS2 domain-containing protein